MSSPNEGSVAKREPRGFHPVAEKHARHINPQFIKLLGVLGYGRIFSKALDVWVWDSEGRRYLDCLAGFGSVNIGHNHPRLIQKLQTLLSENAFHFCHIGPSAHAVDLAEALAAHLAAPLEITLFSNSGAEAVEAGLKLACAATGRREFLFCEGGFHGTNLGALAVMGAHRMRKPFEPLLAASLSVPYGNLEELEKALRKRTFSAFVVEPIQAEGGIVAPPLGYLKEAQALCRRYGTLLLLDEIQTGLGRTGTLWGYESERFVPDIIAIAKALSGGIAPIAATVTSREVHAKAYGSVDRFDLHSSTFAGNALGTTAALETLKILDEEDLCAKSASLGARLLDGLRHQLSHHPLVKEVRGRGLLVGIELGPTDDGWLNRLAPGLIDQISEKIFGQWIAYKLLEKGVICQPASHRWNVIRLEPPLTISETEIDHIVRTVGEVMEEYRDVNRLLRDVSGRVFRQWRDGWIF